MNDDDEREREEKGLGGEVRSELDFWVASPQRQVFAQQTGVCEEWRKRGLANEITWRRGSLEIGKAHADPKSENLVSDPQGTLFPAVENWRFYVLPRLHGVTCRPVSINRLVKTFECLAVNAQCSDRSVLIVRREESVTRVMNAFQPTKI